MPVLTTCQGLVRAILELALDVQLNRSGPLYGYSVAAEKLQFKATAFRLAWSVV